MKYNKDKIFSWEKINEYDEESISYLIFQEVQNIKTVSKIRNLPEEVVKIHILKTKQFLLTKDESSSISMDINNYFGLSKEEKQILFENYERREEIKNLVINNMTKITNLEDIIVLLWTIGELKIIELYNYLIKYHNHPHGNCRRICYSSMGKTEERSFLPYIIEGFSDNKPQVIQYAIIAFAKIARLEDIKYLDAIPVTKETKPYIIRTIENAKLSIYEKYGDHIERI